MIIQKQKSIVHALHAYPAMFFGRAFLHGYIETITKLLSTAPLAFEAMRRQPAQKAFLRTTSALQSFLLGFLVSLLKSQRFVTKEFCNGLVGKRRRLPGAAVLTVLTAFTPVLAFAAVTTSTLVEVIGIIVALINKAIPLALGFAVLFFLWGLAKYILAAADEKKQAEGRTIMIEGIIALTVAVSVWGLVNLINTTLDLESIQSEFPPLIDPDDIKPPKTS